MCEAKAKDACQLSIGSDRCAGHCWGGTLDLRTGPEGSHRCQHRPTGEHLDITAGAVPGARTVR